MYQITIYFPILLYVYQKFSQLEWTENYTSRCFSKLGCSKSINLLMTMMLIHICGFEYLTHYKDAFAACHNMMAPLCNILGYDKVLAILSSITTGMATWKVLLLQRRIILECGPSLCQDGLFDTLFLDWTVMPSFSKNREGSKVGYNKQYKGKPCYQCMLSFLGRLFIDVKLCPGNSNPKVHFKKMVKRALAMGYKFKAVVADAAFGNIENVLLAIKLSLHYALGASCTLGIVATGRETFKKLVHSGSSRIICLKKGLYAFDFGFHIIGTLLGIPRYTRVVMFCRIHRRKKKGKWQVRYYYYAILTDLDWTIRKVHKYYHTRQNIENGIKELKYHYSLNRVPHENLKANEFYIATKLLAMAMLKVFQLENLPKSLQSMRRKTLIRKVFAKTLLTVASLKYTRCPIRVDLCSTSKYCWHFKRIIKKLIQTHSQLYDSKLAG